MNNLDKIITPEIELIVSMKWRIQELELEVSSLQRRLDETLLKIQKDKEDNSNFDDLPI